MALLKIQNTTPPGGWKFYEPATGLTIVAGNLHDLVAKVIEHREHKGVRPTDRATVVLEVQRYMCGALSTAECRSEGPSDPWVPVPSDRYITLADVMAASRAAMQYIVGLGRLEPMEENQRRRRICVTCPLNQPMSGCRCGPLYRAIAAVVPSERGFADLHVCGVCHCSLRVKCAVPADVIRASDRGRGLKYPGHCWVNEVLAEPPAGP